jgi:hypothetical protein
MKRTFLALCLCSALVSAQTPTTPTDDHLSQAEIDAAVAAKPDTGFVDIVDQSFNMSRCTAQLAGISIFTPSGWINARSIGARKQYLPFTPTPLDTMRALTILSKGCAYGSPAGPVCDSITRVALLSDKGGNTVVEAVDTRSIANTWQNGFGATANCSNLVSRFAMSDVAKVRNEKGEFMVAIFSGATLTKTYTVKDRFIKKLGM